MKKTNKFSSIQVALRTVGVFKHYRGYYYFVSAVELAIEEPEKLQSVRKKIYLPVSEMYHTSLSNVEKDIRTVRDVMMRNDGRVLLQEMSGVSFWDNKLPYPREVIGIFAEYFSV